MRIHNTAAFSITLSWGRSGKRHRETRIPHKTKLTFFRHLNFEKYRITPTKLKISRENFEGVSSK